jgi:hypothetical protein
MKLTKSELLYNAAEEGNSTEVARLTSLCNRNGNKQALVCAAFRGHLECVQLLLPNCPSKGNNEALWRAASQGHLECVKLLIKGSDASNALLWAARGGHTQCVRFVMDYVDVTHKEHPSSGLRLSALSEAASRGYADCVRLLTPVSTLEQINHGLLCALENGDMECMQILYPRCDIDAVEEELREDDEGPDTIALERMEELKSWAQRDLLEANVKNSQASKVPTPYRKI